MLNLEATARHVDVLIREGVDGLIMLGTVGENCSLEPGEKLDMLRHIVGHVEGRVPVLSGVAEYTTALAARFAAIAEQIGVDGLMVLPAMVYKSDPRETMAHFRAVARASRLPILCYNNPVSYGVDITPAMFAELADEPTLVAIKESSDNVRRITDLQNLLGNRYLLFSGVDDLFLESVLLGADRLGVGPGQRLSRREPRAVAVGRRRPVRQPVKLYRWYMPLLHLDTRVKLVQYIKLAMAEVRAGLRNRPSAPRLPLVGRRARGSPGRSSAGRWPPARGWLKGKSMK